MCVRPAHAKVLFWRTRVVESAVMFSPSLGGVAYKC